MKGLVKDISSVAIAGLILASGAIGANAEVVKSNVKPSQDAQKSQGLQVTTQVTTKALPAEKQVVNNSPNQAKYLKSSPQNIAAEPSIFLAQESSSTLREQLRVKPLPTAYYVPPASGGNSPSLNFGVPSGFGAVWGNAFVSATGTTAGNRDKIDGSVSVGFGLGSADTLGVEFAYNQGSINNFGKNGTVDVKAHRIVYAEGTNQVSVGVGWNAFAQHVSEGVIPSSLYGVVSSYSLLQPDDPYNKLPISFSVGVGGGQFRPSDESTGVGVFAGAGVQVLPQLSVGASWSGRSINAGISYVPYPEIPLTFVLVGGDLTDNTSGGRILSLSASYGFNFLGK